MKVYIVVPALNEANSIGLIVNRVQQVLPQATVVVVNDGSSDDTTLVAKQAGAVVLTLPFNIGIGGAVQTGLMFATLENADYIVRIDGDGQHPPELIPGLLQVVASGEADVAFGCRFYPGAPRPFISPYRQLGIFMFSRLASLVSGQPVRDPTSGFAAMNPPAARFLALNLTQDYPEVDSRVLLARAGFRVQESPVVMNPRLNGVSSITPWRAFYYIFKVTLSVLSARSRKIVR